MIVVTEVRKTCGMCPSQWEGRTSDGRFVYVRYRYGHLEVGFADTQDAAYDDAAVVFAQDYGDEWCGVLTYGQLRALTAAFARWPASDRASAG